jgi:hypothetical protein
MVTAPSSLTGEMNNGCSGWQRTHIYFEGQQPLQGGANNNYLYPDRRIQKFHENMLS